jgi:hypothetical protein
MGRWDDAEAVARTGAERLLSNGVTGSVTGTVLADLLAARGQLRSPAEAHARLDAARAGAMGNTDFYQPPADVLTAIADAFTA